MLNSTDSIIHSLADTYSAIEECKADSTSTYLSRWFFERGELSESELEETYATMVAGFFRSLRFGLTQAHARANAIQLNYLMARGAVTCDADGRFGYDSAKMADAVRDLVKDVMEIEYRGSHEEAEAFLAKYAVLSDDLSARLATLDDLPVDIVCKYDAEEPGFFNK